MAKIREKFIEHDGSLGPGTNTDEISVRLDGSTLTKGVNGIKISANGVTDVELGALSGDWDITGSAGRILVPNPTSNNHVANKTYVDNAISSGVIPDSITIDFNGSGELEVVDGGITLAKLGFVPDGDGLIIDTNALSVGQGTHITVAADTVSVNTTSLATSLAGNGILATSGVLSVRLETNGGLEFSGSGALLRVHAGSGLQRTAGGLALGQLSADWTVHSTSLYNIKGVKNPVDAQDVATKNYVDTQVYSVSLSVDDSTIQNVASVISVKAAGITGTHLNASVAGNGLTGGAGSPLAVGSGGNGITVSANAIALGDIASNWDITGSVGRILLPTPTSDSHAANKAYVDSVAQGLDVKKSCNYITVLPFTITTTVVAQVQDALDKISSASPTLVVGDRILVKDQTNEAQNGIYEVVSTSGSTVLARSTDANTNDKVTSGMFTFIERGDQYQDSGWVLTTDGNIVLGTTNLSFSQFSGAGQIEAGSGLTKTGNRLNVGAGTYMTVGEDDVSVDYATLKPVLGADIDGVGLIWNSGTEELDINFSSAGGLDIDSGQLVIKLKEDGVIGLDLDANGLSLGVLKDHWNTYDGFVRYRIEGIADPSAAQDAATKNYVDTAVGNSTSFVVDQFVLDATDESNGYVELSETPDPDTLEETILIVKHAGGQYYGDDYEIDIVSTPNRLSWAGLDLEGVLKDEDQLTVLYKV